MVPWESSAPKTSAPVSVCVSKCTRPTGPCAAAQARTSGSVIEWSPPRITGMAPAASTCPTVSWMAAWERTGSAGSIGRVTEVDHPQLGERVHLRLQLRSWRAARRPDGARREARPRPVGDELVHRGAHDRHVRALEVGRILRVGRAAVGQRPGVIWFLAVSRPNVPADLSRRPVRVVAVCRCSWAVRRARGCGRRTPRA